MSTFIDDYNKIKDLVKQYVPILSKSYTEMNVLERIMLSGIVKLPQIQEIKSNADIFNEFLGLCDEMHGSDVTDKLLKNFGIDRNGCTF